MKIGVIGTGYVGLVSGTGFSEMGNVVTCIDTDVKKIENLKEGVLPIYEPGLEELVMKNYQSARLQFSNRIEDAVNSSEVLFICVGTPPDEDGKADLKYVLQVAEQIANSMNEYRVVVTKSTVPVGTGAKVEEKIREILKSRSIDVDFDVVSNPEFLKEGAAVEDFMRPDRIVVGLKSEKAKKIMDKLYAPFVRNGHPVYFMDIPSSEMTKYAANALLATKISFMNEISRLCEKVGADVSNVRTGIGSDPRIGFHFIYPGLGYGGSCFPKDVNALYQSGVENDEEMLILKAVEDVNQKQREWFLSKILKHYNGDVSGLTFGLWGLAFKPGTDDMREAPSVYLVNELTRMGAKVKAYDPVATETAKHAIGRNDSVEYYSKSYEALEDADAMILATEWREFREPDFTKISDLLKTKTIFDGRNQYVPANMKSLGFEYTAVGTQG